MPNWCENTLTVEGSPLDVLKFVIKAKGINPDYLDTDKLSFPLTVKKAEEILEKQKDPGLDKYLDRGGEIVKSSDLREELWRLVRGNPSNRGSLTELSFHNFVPVPDEVLRGPFDGNQAKAVSMLIKDPEVADIGGYDWQTSNWGTKWGVDVAWRSSYVGDIQTEEFLDDSLGDITKVVYCFDSAWSPPIQAIAAIGQALPKLKITLQYEERGNWFAGKTTYEGGDLVEELEFEPEPLAEDEDEADDNWLKTLEEKAEQAIQDLKDQKK